jgi:two-component system, OmpR family, sensor kinase
MLTRLDNAYQQASRFSADASHELRTPLTIIRGELESITRERALPVRILKRIRSVLDEVERLSKITGALFAMSRLDGGDAIIENLKFDLAELTATTTDQMLLLAQDKNISVDIAAGTAVWVRGDPARMKEVVVNLLSNAINYTPEGGKISVRVAKVQDRALLEIADNGIGIPAAALPHVFERFYRVDKARSRKHGGAGLGLSIVRSICEAHGGRIDIESAEGKGTLCRVLLPLPDEGARQKPEPQLLSAPDPARP